MSINLHLPSQDDTLRPRITVIGVGGAGGNAVNNMISARLEGVEFVVANTDAQALDNSLTDKAIQLGSTVTQGLGAGANPEVGRAAAEESLEEIIGYMQGSNMLFITAGMGGGTGTGAAPVIAKAAKDQGILTVGVVTKPFQFEGGTRMNLATSGLDELQQYVDTLIVIPNQNLFRLATEKTTFADAFRMADEVLHSGVRGVTDLMVRPGLVNLDFADIRTVMREMGKAMMGTGEATGDKRAIDAAESAISNPLLDDVSLKGARAALINITGGSDMTLFEVDEAANRIREEIDNDANIIFGSTFSDEMDGVMRVSVVATGIDAEQDAKLRSGGNGNTASASRPKAAPASKYSRYSPAKTAASGATFAGHSKAPAAQEQARAENPARGEQERATSKYAGGRQPSQNDVRESFSEGKKPLAVESERSYQSSAASPKAEEKSPVTAGGFFAAKSLASANTPRTAANLPNHAELRAEESNYSQEHTYNEKRAENESASYAEQENYSDEPVDNGPLFVSPKDNYSPASAMDKAPHRQEAETYENSPKEQHADDGIFGKIAKVGRALTSRMEGDFEEDYYEEPYMEEKPRAESRKETSHEAPQASANVAPRAVEDAPQDKQEEAADNYDIPAFLRRQAN